MKNKILILDIETSPNVAYVWRFFKENVSAKQVLEHSHIMSFACKYLDDDKIFYAENRTNSDKDIIVQLNEVLDEAEMVVAHNGAKFDIPSIRGRALVHGIRPHSPVKIIDTCQIARREFNFPSNSLEYLTGILNCNVKKGGHKKFPGFELWLECLKQNEEAWDELREYNILDVIALEEVYLKMRPWITGHPNMGMHVDSNPEEDRPICPNCGSSHVHLRGYAYTQVGKYHKFCCQDCGGWSRSRYTLDKKNKNILRN